jgi:hypothetical protein
LSAVARPIPLVAPVMRAVVVIGALLRLFFAGRAGCRTTWGRRRALSRRAPRI